MAVESRFVVIRRGVEVKTFMDKKSADEYDKMLDMADNLADMLNESPIALTDNIREELSIYLAEHREELLVALLAKKATKNTASPSPVKMNKKVVKDVAEIVGEVTEEKPTSVSKKVKVKAAKLSEAG